MSLLVVGSVAFDAVETPFGKRDKILGGSAAHFSISASYFTDVRVVAVVFGDFKPKLSEAAKQARLVFLGNIQPDLQRGVREQLSGAELVAIDTMNYWISSVPEEVKAAVSGVHVVIINDAETRQLAGEANLIKA